MLPFLGSGHPDTLGHLNTLITESNVETLGVPLCLHGVKAENRKRKKYLIIQDKFRGLVTFLETLNKLTTISWKTMSFVIEISDCSESF